MKQNIVALVTCAMIVSGGSAALAQSAAPPAGSNSTIPEKAAPDTDIARKNGTLSDKLKDSNGVISPESDVDPAIHKDAPSTGTMPVIPPPGSPGGATGVQPK